MEGEFHQQWQSTWPDPVTTISDPWISDTGTVYWADSHGVLYTRGYDPGAGTWYNGPTLPLAAFVAQPFDDGGVWFTDMSLGGNAWHIDFGDGAANAFRSQLHTYEHEGVFTVTQTVTGPAGSNTKTQSLNLVTLPTGTISINAGARYTTATAVTLTLSASDPRSGVVKMRLSNDNANFTEFPYSTKQSWSLTNGDGQRTVYVQFRDGDGNWSQSFSDTIILDTAAPTGSIKINGGAPFTNAAAVTLTLAASDTSGVTKMRLSNDNVGFLEYAYGTTRNWTLTSGDGQKTVYVQFKDGVGHWSQSVSASITLDTTAPTGSLKINAGAPFTNSTAVTLTLFASDNLSGVARVLLSNDNTNFSEYAYSATRSWTLTSGEGLKRVFARFKDAAGNVSGSVSATITLDTTAPQAGTLSAQAGRNQITLNWSGFSDTASGIKTYQLYYSAKGFADLFPGTLLYTGLPPFTHKGLPNCATRYYKVHAVDNAGNVSPGATAQATTSAFQEHVILLLE